MLKPKTSSMLTSKNTRKTNILRSFFLISLHRRPHFYSTSFHPVIIQIHQQTSTGLPRIATRDYQRLRGGKLKEFQELPIFKNGENKTSVKKGKKTRSFFFFWNNLWALVTQIRINVDTRHPDDRALLKTIIETPESISARIGRTRMTFYSDRWSVHSDVYCFEYPATIIKATWTEKIFQLLKSSIVKYMWIVNYNGIVRWKIWPMSSHISFFAREKVWGGCVWALSRRQ